MGKWWQGGKETEVHQFHALVRDDGSVSSLYIEVK